MGSGSSSLPAPAVRINGNYAPQWWKYRAVVRATNTRRPLGGICVIAVPAGTSAFYASPVQVSSKRARRHTRDDG
jgi:hypothetical protein